MELNELFSNFEYDDLQWFVPMAAGLVIIVGGLLIGMIRGMTAGVIVALFFGGLMCMSPVLLNALERTDGRADRVTAAVARSAAELSQLNNDVVVDLSRVVATVRTALDGLSPLVTEDALDAAVVQRFGQSLTDTEERLDAAIGSLSRTQLLRERLNEDLRDLEAELRRAANPR
ncbi:MAG: hypothetical protein AAF318_18175 [Pseudomonadota bacterium]